MSLATRVIYRTRVCQWLCSAVERFGDVFPHAEVDFEVTKDVAVNPGAVVRGGVLLVVRRQHLLEFADGTGNGKEETELLYV